MEKVKSILASLFEKMGITDAVFELEDDKGSLKIKINSNDEHSLIGKDNEKFEAFSHILKRMLSKHLGDEVKIIIDINNIRSKNEEVLKNKASMIAERAKSFKCSIEMDPMSSYERMLIHSHLEGIENIKTESVGVGPARRLVVKYFETSTEQI